jgi:hypothetical protein
LKYSRNDLDSGKSSQIVIDKSYVGNTSDKDILMGSQQEDVRKFQHQFERDRTKAAQAIIDHIHNVIRGRFLKMNSCNGWFVVSDAYVMVKVYKAVVDMKSSDEKAHNAAVASAAATTTSRKIPHDRTFARQLEKATTFNSNLSSKNQQCLRTENAPKGDGVGVTAVAITRIATINTCTTVTAHSVEGKEEYTDNDALMKVVSIWWMKNIQ